MSIALVSDAAMRRLNRTYRGVDRATDVLSFPDGRDSSSTHSHLGRGLSPAAGAAFLGDIAIAWGTARRQAAAHGHSVSVELRILALHGLLHLLGYDHDRDRGQMVRVEERLRRRAGLPAGLIARTRHRRMAAR